MNPVAEEPLSAEEITPREIALDKGEVLCSPVDEPSNSSPNFACMPEMRSAPPKTYGVSASLDISSMELAQPVIP